MASKVSVKFKIKENVQKLERAFAQANVELEENFNYEIASPLWDWPRDTVRKSGAVVGSPRSIVDSSELLNSYSRRQEGPGRFVHSWSAPHAAITYLGWVGRSGAVVPPRPWGERPLQALPQLFARKYKEQK